MAAIAGIDVPVHGLLSAIDGSWIYFIKRFDRVGRKGRVHVEDFSQLMGSSRETKYESSLEQVTQLVDKFRTFPAVEKPRLAKRLLFCFLTGNEDMHLKNFSIWHREGVTSLTPAYDLLNTTLVLGNASEETALPLGGKQKNLTHKQKNLTHKLWIGYYCHDRLGLNRNQVERILGELRSLLFDSKSLVERSFLSDRAKRGYLDILARRSSQLGL